MLKDCFLISLFFKTMCFIQSFPSGSSSATGFLALQCKVKVPQLRERWCFAMSDTAISIPNFNNNAANKYILFFMGSFFPEQEGRTDDKRCGTGLVFL